MKKPVTPRKLTRAQRNIKWIEEHCFVPEGKDVGKQVKLRPFQKKFLTRVYDNPLGTRRAILSVGRKNAKTALSAFIVLLHLCGPEAKKNSQLFSAAQSRDQAALIFNLAAKTVRMSHSLINFVAVRDTVKQLYCEGTGVLYRALSAEVATAYGLSPALTIHDELGQVKGPRSELYEALETATGAQEDPLSIVISTQAPTDGDLLSILIDDALAGHDPRTICELYTCPIDDDPFTEEAVRKANPAYGDFLNATEVMDMANAASRMPSREAEYRNLVLNQRVEAISPFVSRSVWMSCGAQPKDIHSVPVYAGLDLSSVNDLTAFVKVGMVEKVWQVQPTFWLPSSGLAEKAKTDRVPYDLWHNQGYLETTPGTTVDYEYVAKFLKQEFDSYKIVKIAFDRWNMRHLRPWLEKAGFSPPVIDSVFVEFGQGTQSMSPALRDLQGLLLDAKLAHGNHPVLSMCAACAVVEGKDDANRKLSKNKSTGRIDGMVALTMATAMAMQNKPVDIESLIA